MLPVTEMADNFAFVLPFFMSIFGCIFLALRSVGGASARCWGIGFISASLGFLVPVLLQVLPHQAQSIISNALFLVAFLLYGHGLSLRFHIKPRLWTRTAIAVAGLGVASFLTVTNGSLRYILAVSDLTCALLIILPLVRMPCLPRRAIDRVLVLIVAMVSLETIARVCLMVMLTSEAMSLDDFMRSDYAFVMQVGASLLGFLLGLSVLGSIIQDVIDQHRDEADSDPMTGLLNRRGFEKRVSRRVLDGSIISSDIDHFKDINDRFGHAAGDLAIIAAADCFRRNFPDATIARFGGEEFVAHLPTVSVPAAAVRAEGMRIEFASLNWSEIRIERTVTISIGVAAVGQRDASVKQAIESADRSLYLAKVSGRNKVRVAGEPSQQPILVSV